MSERFRQSVTASVGTGIRIGGSAGRDDDQVEEFGFRLVGKARNDFESASRTFHGIDPRTESEVALGKNPLKSRHHVRSFVGNGKRSEVVLNLDGASVRIEPFTGLFGRKRSEGFLHEVRSARIFRKELLFGRNAGSDVTASSASDGDFLPHFEIPVEEGDRRGRNPLFDKRRRDHHARGACSNYCDFHEVRLTRAMIPGKGPPRNEKTPFGAYRELLCEYGSTLILASWSNWGAKPKMRSWFSARVASSSATSGGKPSRL